MNGLIAAVNLNTQDVEEGQLPDDDQYRPQPSPAPPRYSPPPAKPSQDLSGEIELEVVDDRSHDRRTRKIAKDARARGHSERQQTHDRDRGQQERLQKQRKAQRNEKRPHAPQHPEREEMKNLPNHKVTNYQQQPPPFYPPYMYHPHPMQMQFPAPYPPYPYQMAFMQPPYPNAHSPPFPNHPPPFPNVHHPEFMMERPRQAYKPHPYPPGYSQPSFSAGYNPYDHYERHREAQQREDRHRMQRKRDYLQELRVELKRNVREFNGEESGDILEAAKCILKFQEARDRESLAQRSYDRSLYRLEAWLEGDNARTREFTKGLLEAMQMGDVIARAKELARKQEETTHPLSEQS